MEIIVESNRIEFDPEKQKWERQNPPSEFCFAKIGKHNCFVKRQENQFSGWGLLKGAVCDHKQIVRTPKILSIAKLLSKNFDREHWYFFASQIEGMTVAEKIKKDPNFKINGKKIMDSLFAAVFSINNLGFWYTDLCKKNFFIENFGEYYLIDIDSCVSHQEKFKCDRKVSQEYQSILTEFSKAKNIFTFHLEGMSGECVNQAELVAIAVDAKNSFRIPIEKKCTVIHNILHKEHQSEYVYLFTLLASGKADWAGTKNLIKKITS